MAGLGGRDFWLLVKVNADEGTCGGYFWMGGLNAGDVHIFFGFQTTSERGALYVLGMWITTPKRMVRSIRNLGGGNSLAEVSIQEKRLFGVIWAVS